MTADAADEIAAAWARELPAVPVESIPVITRVWQAAKLLGDERRRTLAALGVDAATLELLSTLRRDGPPYRLAPGELARRCLVTPGAITQRVTRAEAAGLVQGLRVGRRAHAVELTLAGHDLVDRTVHGLLSHEAVLLDHLDDAQRDQLAELLRVLLDGVTDRLGVDRRAGPVGGTSPAS